MVAEMAEPSGTNNSTTAVSLNDLPHNILLRILSSLPTTVEAIETSLLSRKWRNLWRSMPSLSFSCHLFFTPNSYPSPITLRSFIDFIEQTLILRPPNSPLHSFKLQFDFPHRKFKFSSHVNSWIRFAISNNVETLDFDLYDYSGNCLKRSMDIEIENDVQFVFPFYLLRDGQVRVLKLGGCDLSLPSENSRFLSLRSVSLEQVIMTDQMLVDLMAACVNVESLVMSCLQGCKHYKICSSKLRELTLKLLLLEDGSIEIVTPNLYTLNILTFHLGDYVLTDVSSLVEANVSVSFFHCWAKVMRYLQHIQRLTTPNMWFELLESKDIYSECRILQNLNYVELQTSYNKNNMMGIAQLLVLSPNLETLIIANCPILLTHTYDESISEDFIRQLSFDMPRLRHIKMTSFMGTACEKNLLIVLLKTSAILEMIVIIPAEVTGETPEPPIILKDLQDFENFVRPYPKHKTLKERYQHLQP